jgi:2-polyprenyl-6-methoxyphenol hydroxylase-like FAD-dependent oxidoreductase
MHAERRTAKVPLFDRGLANTDYPFLPFVSRAEIEAVLNQRLARAGITVERGVELVGMQRSPDHVTCALRTHGGRPEHVPAWSVDTEL